MNVLFFGDVVGQASCEFLRQKLPALRRMFDADIVIANGENSAEGNGISAVSAKHLLDSGVQIITGGNHTFRRREIYELLDKQDGILRPANCHPSAPGSGVYHYDHPSFPLTVINLMGRVYMDGVHVSPFDCADELLKNISCPNIIVDFHAEATAEKRALGFYLDGRVSAVLGTHTHVQTADECILPNGTAYITDAGMCGGTGSILGVQRQTAIDRLRTGLPHRFTNDPENIQICGVALSFEGTDGKVGSIERIQIQ